MRKWLDDLQPWGAFVLRFVLGAAMVYAGWGKVIPARGASTFSAVDHWAHVVASMGLPYWLGYVSALTEFVGGILLLIGLLTRFVSLLVALNMLVALWKVNFHHGYAATMTQYNLALIAMAIMLLFYGAGAAAVDRKLGFA